MVRFDKLYQGFLKSQTLMTVIHESRAPKVSIDPSFYILDSSFNPPHFGHLELIKRAAVAKGHVVLLLSITNADKAPMPASFDQRLDMMYEFGQYLVSQMGFQYSIVLSKSPRFIDKSLEINRIYQNGMKHYLLGFDTLIRVFDQKYYSMPIDEALEQFVMSNKFICLTRDKDITEQVKYLKELETGKLGLPTHWSGNIQLIVNELDNSVISSSGIRNVFKAEENLDDSCLDSRTIPNIESYIVDNNLYS